MEFRRFTKEDVAQASILLANRHKKERIIFPELKRKFEDIKCTEKVINELMARDFFIGVCACENDNLLGFLLSNIESNGGRLASIDYEGMGIGNLLVKSLFNVSVEKGYKNVFINWSISNLESSNFWPKQGVKPVAYRMYRRIDEDIYWADGVRRLER